jgi:hypothetical protein
MNQSRKNLWWKNSTFALLWAIGVFSPLPVHADTFGNGEGAFEIEFVSVPSVGKYEIPSRQGSLALPGMSRSRRIAA